MSDRPHYGSPVAARLNELEDQIARLTAALRFYAEGRNLHVEWSGETQIRDRGEHAREALEHERAQEALGK